MSVHAAKMSDIFVIERRILRDSRGSFERVFCGEEMFEVLGNRKIRQINFSRTLRTGTVRGMHYQMPPRAELKVVSCLRGRVFDVAVDLRLGSPTFLHVFSIELSAENGKALVIPEGCAHGFQSLTDECELLYLHTAPYASDLERSVNSEDPALAIQWPLPISERSDKDAAIPFIEPTYLGVQI